MDTPLAADKILSYCLKKENPYIYVPPLRLGLKFGDVILGAPVINTPCAPKQIQETSLDSDKDSYIATYITDVWKYDIYKRDLSSTLFPGESGFMYIAVVTDCLLLNQED